MQESKAFSRPPAAAHRRPTPVETERSSALRAARRRQPEQVADLVLLEVGRSVEDLRRADERLFVRRRRRRERFAQRGAGLRGNRLAVDEERTHMGAAGLRSSWLPCVALSEGIVKARTPSDLPVARQNRTQRS